MCEKDVGVVFKRDMEGVVGAGATEEVAEAPSSYQTGTNALSVHREGMEVKSVIENGLISDWTAVSQLLSHTFIERLHVDVKEHPVLLSEPSFNTSALREKATELLFETHGVPALFLAKSAVLASFAHARSTSIVLESGGGTTCAVPVHDGYVLTRSIVKSHLAGDELSKIYEHVVKTTGGIEIRPNFMLNKKQTKEGEFKVTNKTLSGVTSSFRQYHNRLVAQDLKETTCKIFDTELDLDSSSPLNDDPTSFVFPDQTAYTPGLWRFRVPEILFNPKKYLPDTYEHYSQLSSLPGIHSMMHQAISSCDADLKKDLYQSILVTGGNTLLPGFTERFISELSSLFGPQVKLKNQSLPTGSERKYATFIGGSILGSLGTFHQMWMSKQEYDEYGRGIVDRKCP